MNQSSSNLNSCIICAENCVDIWSIGSCHHIYCWKCSLRLRHLFQSQACPLCKKIVDTVILTQNPQLDYALTMTELTTKGSKGEAYLDKRNGIYFIEDLSRQKAMNLMSLSCPLPFCKTIFQDRKEFLIHAKKSHQLLICDICYAHQKYFLSEIPLFQSSAALQKHQKSGDGMSFKGHPKCGFCETYYYSSDELYEHCRDKHEVCFICKNYFKKPYEYFENYKALFEHFTNDHFICDERDCLEKKFIVFPSELELKAHRGAEHLKDKKGQQRSEKIKALSINIDLQSGAITQQKSMADSRTTMNERIVSPPTEEFLSFFGKSSSSNIQSGNSKLSTAVRDNYGASPSVEIHGNKVQDASFGSELFPTLTTKIAPMPSGGFRTVDTRSDSAFPALDRKAVLKSRTQEIATSSSSAHHTLKYNEMARPIQRHSQNPNSDIIEASQAKNKKEDDFPALILNMSARGTAPLPLKLPEVQPSTLLSLNVSKKGKSKIVYRLA